MRIWVGIIIKVGDDLTFCRLHTYVPGAAQAAVFRTNQAKAVVFDNVRRSICRSIIYDNHFEVRVLQSQESFKALTNRATPVVRTNNHGNERPASTWWKGNLGERRASRS